MKTLRMKTVRLGSLALFIALFGSACGQPPGEGADALKLIAASADTTTAEGTARMTMHMTMSMPQGEVTMDAEGSQDFANQRGEMTMTMQMPPEAGAMGGEQKIEMVFADLIVYMKFPMMSELAPGSKPWISMDLQKMGEEAGMDFGSLMQSGGNDPSQMLEWLRGVSGDIEVVGEEEVRGAPATHYRGTIDLKNVLEQMAGEMRSQMESTIDEMTETLGASTFPIDVWIDGEGRVVRMAQSFDFEKGATAGAFMTMTMDFFDFGIPVDVRVPPASQTTDFQELMGSMGSMGSGTAP